VSTPSPDPPTTRVLHHDGAGVVVEADSEYDLDEAEKIVERSDTYRDALFGVSQYPHADVAIWSIEGGEEP
jgi:hypothetical protein